MLINDNFFIKKGSLFISFSVFLAVSFFSPLCEAQNVGFSGEVGFVFSRDEIESGVSETELTSFEQRYSLNYRNYVYKPRLLTYSLGGSFKRVDAEADQSDATAESIGYDVRLNFLSQTPYPFTIWYDKRTPTSFSSQLTGDAVFNKQDVESLGIRGGLYLKRLPRIRYTFKQENKETTGSTGTTDERDRQFLLSAEKEWKSIKTRFMYEYESSLDRNTNTAEKSHDFRFLGNSSRRLSNVTDVYFNAEFHKNTFSDITEILASTLLNYIPSSRFRGRAGLNYNHTINLGEGGDSILTNLNTVYKLGKHITVGGDSLVAFNTGYFGDNISEDIGASVSYVREIAQNTRLTSYAKLGVGARQGDPIDRTTMDARTSSTLTRNFPSSRTSVSTTADAGYFTSSAGGRSESYSISLNTHSQLIQRLTAISQYAYVSEKSIDDTINSVSGTTVSSKKFLSDFSLLYFVNFGWRARLDVKSGLLMERGSTNRDFFYIDETLNYIILQNLLMRIYSRYDYESIDSVNTLFFNIDFDYRIRSIITKLRYEWRRREGEFFTDTITHLLLEILRPF
jgi:hypothetical protein